MGKNKIKRFEELTRLERVFQPVLSDIFRKDFYLKGRWKEEVFKNSNPLILELGCGRGEYTLGLSLSFPDKNFIGVDIKGARLWKGAKDGHLGKIENSAFLRTRIEFINSFFSEDEVDEIWLTFPDPQAKPSRKMKRLSSSVFLGSYQQFLKNQGIVHLKTDSELLFSYTLSLARHNKLEVLTQTNDLYNSGLADDILGIKTFYENQYLKTGKNICYLKFLLPKNKPIEELPDEKIA